MNSIESSVFVGPNLDNTNGRGGQSGNRHAWLNSMEQAGLINALRETKMIKAGGEIVLDNQATEIGSGFSNRTISERANLSPPVPKKSTHPSSGANQVNADAEPLSRGITSQWVKNAPIASSGQQNYGRDLVGIKPELVKVLSGLLATRQPYEWALKNVVTLRSSEGLEVWVRDANMDSLKIVDFLKGLRQSIGSLGVNLVKVVVNGKEMFSQQSSSSVNL